MIYWKLEVLSCVLVLRKREWFKNNIGQLGNVWAIVEQERVTGYEHRAPKSTFKKGGAKIVPCDKEGSKTEVNFFNFIKNKSTF